VEEGGEGVGGTRAVETEKKLVVEPRGRGVQAVAMPPHNRVRVVGSGRISADDCRRGWGGGWRRGGVVRRRRRHLNRGRRPGDVWGQRGRSHQGGKKLHTLIDL
jgi:hypothetical protein